MFHACWLLCVDFLCPARIITHEIEEKFSHKTGIWHGFEMNQSASGQLAEYHRLRGQMGKMSNPDTHIQPGRDIERKKSKAGACDKILSKLTDIKPLNRLISIRAGLAEAIQRYRKIPETAENTVIKKLCELSQDYKIDIEPVALLERIILDLPAEKGVETPLVSFINQPSVSVDDALNILPRKERNRARILVLEKSESAWPYNHPWRFQKKLPKVLSEDIGVPISRIEENPHHGYLAFIPDTYLRQILSLNLKKKEILFSIDYYNLNPRESNPRNKSKNWDRIPEKLDNAPKKKCLNIGKSAKPVRAIIKESRKSSGEKQEEHEWVATDDFLRRLSIEKKDKEKGKKKFSIECKDYEKNHPWGVSWNNTSDRIHNYDLTVYWVYVDKLENSLWNTDYLISFSDAQRLYRALGKRSKYLYGLIPLPMAPGIPRDNITPKLLLNRSQQIKSVSKEHQQGLFIRVPPNPPIRRFRQLWPRYNFLNRIYDRSNLRAQPFRFIPVAGRPNGILEAEIDGTYYSCENFPYGEYVNIMVEANPEQHFKDNIIGTYNLWHSDNKERIRKHRMQLFPELRLQRKRLIRKEHRMRFKARSTQKKMKILRRRRKSRSA